MTLKMMTNGKGLDGLDTKQPWGMVIVTDGRRQTIQYGFLPVTDLKQLVEVARNNPQLEDAIQLDGDVYEIQTGGPAVYMKAIGKWAVLTDQRENLADAPADPLKLLGDLPKRYDLAVCLSVRNTPKEYRDMAIAQLQAVPEGGLPQLPDESDDHYAARVDATRYVVQGITAMVNELDTVLLGVSVDLEAKAAHLDYEMTALPGTRLAQRLAAMQPGNTEFAGLLAPDAAVTANWTRTLTDADVTETNNVLAMMRKSLAKELKDKGFSEADAKLASEVLDDVAGVIEKTVATKKTDLAMMVRLDAGAATVVAGGAVSSGDRLESVLKRLAAKVQQEDAEAAKSIKLNAETHEGVHFHTFTLPVPDPTWAALLGDKLEVVFGTGSDKLMVAAGRDAAKALEKVINESKAAGAKEVPPMRISLATTPFARFIAQGDDDDEVKMTAGMFAAALKKAGGGDHIVITAQAIPQGVRLRLEVEEGLFKSLATLGLATMPGN